MMTTLPKEPLKIILEKQTIDNDKLIEYFHYANLSFNELSIIRNICQERIINLSKMTSLVCESIPSEIWIEIFRLLYDRKNITTTSNTNQFSIRSVCKIWLKIFSEILFVEIRITYNNNYSSIIYKEDNNIRFYEGEWKNLKKEGRGKLVGRHGRIIYEGEFKNNMREGKGNYYYNHEMRYEGEFKNNMIEGRGNIYFTDGERYEGELKNSKKEGKGTYYYSNGDRYEGEFKNNMKEGKGTYYYSNGDRYEGEFKNGYHFSDGKSGYIGKWKNNKREGSGYYSDGNNKL